MTESKMIFPNDSIDPWNTPGSHKRCQCRYAAAFTEGNAVINIQRDTKINHFVNLLV